ncbi:hypothetical protein [Henriciella litoralis]|uniref:hypothetical protein n=1 Tax=Henriciella litoralis TaxID=568102 RepID=UPI00146BF3D2|nr:hypothetical protein [Henriciella litoralis]
MAGCGGGSSGGGGTPNGGPPPPPPPPPGNGGPDIRIELSSNPVLEQNIFVIDTFDTTDPDGDSFNITLRQTSGPAAEQLEDVNAYATKWRAPDITTNTTATMVFEIRAEDSRGAVSTKSANVQLRGFSGPGRPVALLDQGARLEVGNIGTTFSEVFASVPAVAGSPNNPRDLVLFGEDTTKGYFDYSRTDLATVEPSFSGIAQIVPNGLGFNGVEAPNQFVVVEEGANKISLVNSDRSVVPGGTFQLADSFAIDQPCYFEGRTNTGQDFGWVGQRDNGLAVVRITPDNSSSSNQFDSEVIFDLNSDRSLCHIFPTELPADVYTKDPFDESNFSPLIAVDFDSNELVLYGDTDETQEYVELTAIPLQTETTEQMTIVDVLSFGSPSLKPRYMVVLLTDGKDGGQQRLIMVSQDNSSEEISQETFAWTGGVPVGLVQGAFVGVRPADQKRLDLVVVTESGQAMVFENTLAENQGVGEVPSFAEPKSFAIEPGAGSAATAKDDNFSDNVVMVANPGSGVVRVYKPVDLVSQ